MKKPLTACLLLALFLVLPFQLCQAAPHFSSLTLRHFPTCERWLIPIAVEDLNLDADDILAVGLFSEFAFVLDRELRKYDDGVGLAQKIYGEFIRFLKAYSNDAGLGATVRSFTELPPSGPDLLFVLMREMTQEGDRAYHVQLTISDEIQSPLSLLMVKAPPSPLVRPISLFVAHLIHEYTHHVDLRMLDEYMEINLRLPSPERDSLFVKFFDLKAEAFEPGFNEFFRETRGHLLELTAREFFWRNPMPGRRQLTENEIRAHYKQLRKDLIENLTVKTNGYPDASRFRVRQKIPKEEIFATGLSYGEAMRNFIERHRQVLTRP